MPEELPGMPDASNLWDVKTGQKSPLDWAEGNLVPSRTICKENKDAEIMSTRLTATGLNVKTVV